MLDSPLPEHYPAIFAASKAKPTTSSCEQLFREMWGAPGDIQPDLAWLIRCGRKESLGEARFFARRLPGLSAAG